MAAECSTDNGTLKRVAGALRAQMAGVDVLSRHDHLVLPAETLERRTVTVLGPGYARCGGTRVRSGGQP